MLNNRRVHTIHIIALLFSIFPSGFADELFIFPNGKSITWRFDEGIHFLFFFGGPLSKSKCLMELGVFPLDCQERKHIFVETCSFDGKRTKHFGQTKW